MLLDDDKGFFKSFSKGKESGDVITLYSMTLGNRGDSPRDSAIALSAYMGVDIEPELLTGFSGTSKTALSDALSKLTSKLNLYLSESDNEDAHIARQYLHKRGLTDIMRDEWSLGLFPSDIDEAREMVDSCGDRKILKEAGIYGGKRGDFIPMIGRLAFPILGRNSKTISFSSRVIPGVFCFNKESKYINTSSTAVYDKSSALYGQHLLSSQPEKIILCEGNFDVIALNQMAEEGTVALATCGTAITEAHAHAIKTSKNKKTYVLFDADESGRIATASSLWMNNHIDNMFVPSIESSDPWEAYINQESLDDILEYARPIIPASVSIMSELSERQELIDWCSRAYETLNFSDDKNLLLRCVSQSIGLKQSSLKSLIAKEERKGSQRATNNKHKDSISSHISVILSALLSFDSMERSIICFPLRVKTRFDENCDTLGATEIDREALKVVCSDSSRGEHDEKLLSYIYSLMPIDNDYSYFRKEAAGIIAQKILEKWKSDGIPEGGGELVNALFSLSMRASAAQGDDALAFVFDAIEA